MIKSAQKKLRILGVNVNSTTQKEVLDFVLFSLKNKKKFFIATPNPEIIVAAQKDRQLREALNSADIALPDGVGLRLAGNFRERLTGREMFEELLKIAQDKKLKVYLLGASMEVNSKAVSRINKLYPNINAEGNGDIHLNNEGYSVIDGEIKKHIVILKHINRFKPDLLFVAFGFPKQEKWVFNNLSLLNIGGAMVVGGALDYFVGKMPKPPMALSALGLEWLWRVLLEPARWGRIFNATIMFPAFLLKDKFTSLR